MRSIIARVAGMAAVVVLMVLQSASAVVMKPGVEYSEGTRVDTPGTGASFIIPDSYTGILPHGATFFVMGSKVQKSYIFVQVDQMNAADALENMGNPYPLGHGMTLMPTGKIRKIDQMLVAHYSVEGSPQPLKGYIEARISDGGLSIRYIAISAPETATHVHGVVHNLIQDTELDK
ncbi:MAG TPA: hypothetical protein VHJ19_04675 [Gammaproteobacteria bacterium]|nr:hypothetical protein [Gammaproteobacteria bacterium]